MKINTVDGNILTCPNGINTIVHQANTCAIMGGGVALALKNKWPQVYEVDKAHYQKALDRGMEMYNDETDARVYAETERLGKSSAAEIELENKKKGWCINLYGQRLRRPTLAGCATDYNAVVAAFNDLRKALNSFVERGGEIHVGIPYLMGCGLAGGDWRIYQTIIESCLADGASFPITFVKYNG